MGWVLKALGLLLTGLAVSLGAPFWFDVLNKIVVVRSTVSPGEKARGSRPQRHARGTTRSWLRFGEASACLPTWRSTTEELLWNGASEVLAKRMRYAE